MRYLLVFMLLVCTRGIVHAQQAPCDSILHQLRSEWKYNPSKEIFEGDSAWMRYASSSSCFRNFTESNFMKLFGEPSYRLNDNLYYVTGLEKKKLSTGKFILYVSYRSFNLDAKTGRITGNTRGSSSMSLQEWEQVTTLPKTKGKFAFVPPSPSFMKYDTANYREKGGRYLDHYYGKAGAAYALEQGSYEDSVFTCGYKQRYKGGILYEYSECGESGVSILIFLPTDDVSVAIRFIGTVLREDNNVWDPTYRHYAPKEEGAGCYYDIRKTPFGIIIEGYCGC